MEGVNLPKKGYEIKFPDETPTEDRIETINKLEYCLIRESGLHKDNIFIEAWREQARYAGEKDMNVIRLYVITPEILT